jgi:hypothetical protein
MRSHICAVQCFHQVTKISKCRASCPLHRVDLPIYCMQNICGLADFNFRPFLRPFPNVREVNDAAIDNVLETNREHPGLPVCGFSRHCGLCIIWLEAYLKLLCLGPTGRLQATRDERQPTKPKSRLVIRILATMAEGHSLVKYNTPIQVNISRGGGKKAAKAKQT